MPVEADLDDDHYLKRELYQLVRADGAIFEFLQAGSLDGIWYWDLEHPEHEWMSPRFWSVLGYDPATQPHLVSAWQDIIDADDLAVAMSNFERHCEDPAHPYDQTVRYRRRDGSTAWIRCRGMAIRDASGKPVRLLGAHTDITELKQTEAQLREALASNEELEQFAYVASHDLREPLRLIGAYLELLTEKHGEMLGADASRLVGVAAGAATRMQALLSGLLDYAHIGASLPELKPVDLAGLLAGTLESLDVVVKEAGAKIVLQQTFPEVDADAAQIDTVLQNIIANALKFRGSQPPVIHISATALEDWCVVAVRDNGIGLDPSASERVFQMFQRLHSETEYPGTGVGLAIARRIIERHGGRMWVDSEPGRGACFNFSLPLHRRPEP